jgi:hypothetical protein
MVALYIYLVLVLNLIICQRTNTSPELQLNARRQLRWLLGSYLYNRFYNPVAGDSNENEWLCCFLFRSNRVDADTGTSSSYSGNDDNDIEVSCDSYVSMDNNTESSDESKDEHDYEQSVRQPMVV